MTGAPRPAHRRARRSARLWPAATHPNPPQCPRRRRPRPAAAPHRAAPDIDVEDARQPPRHWTTSVRDGKWPTPISGWCSSKELMKTQPAAACGCPCRVAAALAPGAHPVAAVLAPGTSSRRQPAGERRRRRSPWISFIAGSRPVGSGKRSTRPLSTDRTTRGYVPTPSAPILSSGRVSKVSASVAAAHSSAGMLAHSPVKVVDQPG